MYLIRSTSQFRKSLKRHRHSGRFDQKGLQRVVDTLAAGKVLDEIYRDHELTAELAGNRECHIRPDLLLIYRIENNKLVLVLVNLGSHSDLFD